MTSNHSTGFELVRIDPSSLSPDAVVRVRLAPLPGGRHFRLHHPENPEAGRISDDLVLTFEDAKLLTGILHDVLGTLTRGRRAQHGPAVRYSPVTGHPIKE